MIELPRDCGYFPGELRADVVGVIARRVSCIRSVTLPLPGRRVSEIDEANVRVLATAGEV